MARYCEHCGAPLHKVDRICLACGELVLPTDAMPEEDATMVVKRERVDEALRRIREGQEAPAGEETVVVKRETVDDAIRRVREGEPTPAEDALSPVDEAVLRAHARQMAQRRAEAAAAEAEAAALEAEEERMAHETLGVGGYLGALLVFALPVVGFIVCLIWACGGTGNLALRRLSRAQLILALISTVLSVLVLGLVAPYLATLFDLLAQGLPMMG